MSTIKNPPPPGHFWHTEFRRASVSKYPVTYYSESKRVHVAIEDMNTPWLLNSWRKSGGAEPSTAENRDLIMAMETELESRGCTYDSETGRWTMPPKPEEGA